VSEVGLRAMVESMLMGTRQRKSHGQRLFMIRDGECDRDFFLVLLACP
jgi:hypothetical protein